MQIAQATGDNCTARAISTMRLALGYETGLPSDWEEGTKKTHELAALAGECFPNETVIIGCCHEEIEKITLPANARYIGDEITWGEKDGQINPDDYLIAFTYSHPNTSQGHMVIGFPAVYDFSTFIIGIVIAVSLQKRKTKGA